MMADPVRDALIQRLHQSLRCPGCHAGLAYQTGKGEIRCGNCQVVFPVLNGRVPALLLQNRRVQFATLLNQDQGGVRMAEEYRRYGTWRGKVRNLLKPPSIVYDVDVARKYSWIYDTRGEATLVLSIGGGPGRENPRVINLNVDAFDSVDLVGDGTNIPLVDGAVDTVTCNAVIEHVSNPAELLSEMYRVLAPGGYAQLMVPFVFPFHAYPSDYQRYSTMGILELTRSFDKVELCVLTGPTSALAVLFREYLRLLVPGGNGPFLRPVLNGISGWLTFPIKYLDLWLNRKPEAAHMAAAFYYLGRKPSG
jgi:LSD1 subclass zinc finger protein